MRLLLDTHTLLWFALDDPQLSTAAREAITEPANEKFVSPASYWEIAIKISVGKYTLSGPFEDFMSEAIDMNGFQHLHIQPRHAALLTAMPYHHRDPFDRMLIAQAQTENLTLVSADVAFDAYGVNRSW